jgi:hypothetical protein
MDKSSKVISLALIGTAFLVGGCSRQDEEENNQQAGNHVGGRGVFIAPRIGGGFGGGGRGGVGTAPSARGGFGSTGSFGAGSVGAAS